MSAQTIDEVIEALEKIIESAKLEENPLGYFAALYHTVTVTIKNNLGKGYFDDDARMEKLDVIFANRYIDAYTDYLVKKPISKSWEASFEDGKEDRFIVLQHLMFGMNAHINLDLGIAAAQITDPSTIGALKDDFNKINVVLGSLVNEVQEDLGKIWPKLLWILKFFKKTDDEIVNFGMGIARDGAWKFANQLVVEDPADQVKMIIIKDKKVCDYLQFIQGNSWIERIVFKVIRKREHGTIREKIEALENKRIDLI